jgi:hypothetical protein
MLVAFFDASKTQLGKSYITVAGCLASIDKWNCFHSEWQELLNEEGLQFFHMTDFEAYQGSYKGWNRERHNNCFGKLSDVIVRRTDFAFGRGVANEDFEWAKEQNEHLQSWSAFTFCAIQCLHGIAHWASNRNYRGDIAYVFESGDGYKGELLKLSQDVEGSIERKMRFRWEGLHILQKLEKNSPYPLAPLQAADVWAFEARKEWENKYAVGERTRPVRQSVRCLLGRGVDIDFGFSTRDSLASLNPYWLK